MFLLYSVADAANGIAIVAPFLIFLIIR